MTIHNSNSQNLSTLLKIPLYTNTDRINLVDALGNNLGYQVLFLNYRNKHYYVLDDLESKQIWDA